MSAVRQTVMRHLSQRCFVHRQVGLGTAARSEAQVLSFAESQEH